MANNGTVTLDLGSNVVATIEGSKLTLTIDLKKNFGRSASGKSTIIATTSGNKQLPAGQYVGLNIYSK